MSLTSHIKPRERGDTRKQVTQTKITRYDMNQVLKIRQVVVQHFAGRPTMEAESQGHGRRVYPVTPGVAVVEEEEQAAAVVVEDGQTQEGDDRDEGGD